MGYLGGPIDFSNLSDKVYNILLDRIITRKIRPGDKLPEEEIAQELGISRTPIREALNRLFSDDLIELIPKKGGYVKKFTARDIAEHYEIREALECLAVRLAVPLIKEKELLKLKRLVDKNNTAPENNRKNADVNFDWQLHSLIIASCGNKHLQKILTSLLNFCRAFIMLDARHDNRRQEACQEHQEILEALINKDTEQAAKLMSRHINKAKEIILAEYNF